MKNMLSALWAAIPSSNRREPTGQELSTGFPCGPADQQLFNEFMFRLSAMNAEIVNAITRSGQTPLESDLEQLWKSMQRAARGTAVIYIDAGVWSWVVPAGVTRVLVRVWGAGGGGGGAHTPAGTIATGGAGGGYTEGVVTVTPLSTISVTVGAGGAGGGGSPTNGNGVTGGTSSFGGLISSTGGGGGVGSGGGIQSSVNPPGSGTGGTLNLTGTGGGLGYALGNGNYVMAAGGGGAFASRDTSVGVTGAAATGSSGIFPGGGAQGGAMGNAGGTGAKGLVIIEY